MVSITKVKVPPDRIPDLTGIDNSQFYPGSSSRLNVLLDNLTISVPRERGRKAFFARLMDIAPQHATPWLEDDCPTVNQRLRALSLFIADKLDRPTKYTPIDVEIWILYGTGAIGMDRRLASGC